MSVYSTGSFSLSDSTGDLILSASRRGTGAKHLILSGNLIMSGANQVIMGGVNAEYVPSKIDFYPTWFNGTKTDTMIKIGETDGSAIWIPQGQIYSKNHGGALGWQQRFSIDGNVCFARGLRLGEDTGHDAARAGRISAGADVVHLCLSGSGQVGVAGDLQVTGRTIRNEENQPAIVLGGGSSNPGINVQGTISTGIGVLSTGPIRASADSSANADLRIQGNLGVGAGTTWKFKTDYAQSTGTTLGSLQLQHNARGASVFEDVIHLKGRTNTSTSYQNLVHLNDADLHVTGQIRSIGAYNDNPAKIQLTGIGSVPKNNIEMDGIRFARGATADSTLEDIFYMKPIACEATDGATAFGTRVAVGIAELGGAGIPAELFTIDGEHQSVRFHCPISSSNLVKAGGGYRTGEVKLGYVAGFRTNGDTFGTSNPGILYLSGSNRFEIVKPKSPNDTWSYDSISADGVPNRNAEADGGIAFDVSDTHDVIMDFYSSTDASAEGIIRANRSMTFTIDRDSTGTSLENFSWNTPSKSLAVLSHEGAFRAYGGVTGSLGMTGGIIIGEDIGDPTKGVVRHVQANTQQFALKTKWNDDTIINAPAGQAVKLLIGNNTTNPLVIDDGEGDGGVVRVHGENSLMLSSDNDIQFRLDYDKNNFPGTSTISFGKGAVGGYYNGINMTFTNMGGWGSDLNGSINVSGYLTASRYNNGAIVMGPWPSSTSTTWGGIFNEDALAADANNYALLLNNSGRTLLNCADGEEVQIWSANSGVPMRFVKGASTGSAARYEHGGLKIGTTNLQDYSRMGTEGQVMPYGIHVECGNSDVNVLRMTNADDAMGYGYSIVYSGSGSGINNKFEIHADNVSAGDPTVKVFSSNLHGIASVRGNRQRLDCRLDLSTSDLGTERFFYLGPDASSTDVDSSSMTYPDQIYRAWVAPFDGWIEYIDMVARYGMGTETGLGNKDCPPCTIRIYKQGQADNGNINFTDDLLATYEIKYGNRKVNVLGIVHDSNTANMVQRSDTFVASSTTYQSPPIAKTGWDACKFSAGDKLWISFEAPSGVTQFYDHGPAPVTGTSLTSNTNYCYFGVNLVIDSAAGNLPIVLEM